MMKGRFTTALVLALFAGPALAAEEIDAPAGDLPQGDDLQGQPGEAEGPTLDAGQPDDAAAGNERAGDEGGPAEDGGKKQPDGDSEIRQPAWDSYDDKGTGTAEEITKGVRVEDIIEPPSDYRYAAFGKGDPFVPPVITEESKVVNPLEIPIVSPLQRFRLQELSLVGIWQRASGERKAMIMTPDGQGSAQGIIVKNGDPIGQRGGRILGIGDDYITVREFKLAPDGTRQYEDQQMFMGRRSFEDVDGKIRFEPGAKEPKVIIEGDDGGGAGAIRPVTPGVAPTGAGLDQSMRDAVLQRLRSQAEANAAANAGKVAAGPDNVGAQMPGAGQSPAAAAGLPGGLPAVGLPLPGGVVGNAGGATGNGPGQLDGQMPGGGENH